MFFSLLDFELKLHFRQVGFWVVFSLLFLIGALFVVLGLSGILGAGERIKLNGAVSFAAMMNLVSFTSILFGAVYVVTGIMRDDASNALEMIHATPVLTSHMTLSRMIGVFLAVLISTSAGVLGIFFSQFWPGLDRTIFGPVNLLYFLHPFILFLGVNALLVTGFFTAVAGLTRDRTLVYVSAIALFLLTLLGGAVSTLDVPQWILILLDPLGDNSYAREIEYWSVEDRNTRLVSVFSGFGLNRLVWALIGLGCLVGTFRLFRRGLFTRKGKISSDEVDLDLVEEDATVDLKSNLWLTLWSRLRLEFGTSVTSTSFIVLMAFSMSIFALFTIIIVFFDFSQPAVMVNNVLMSELAFVGAFLPLLFAVIFFSGEIIWRDRSVKIIEIVDGSPAQSAAIMLGKWLAMIGIILTFVGGAMLIGIITQFSFALFRETVPVDVLVHLQNAYLSFTPRIVFLAILAMFIQNFMPTRIAGMVAAGLIVLPMALVVPFLPFVHPLFEFGIASPGGYSDISGFSRPINLIYFGTYWSGVCGVLAVITIWLWRRGLYPDFSVKRLAQFKFLSHFRHVPGRLSAATVIAGAVFLGAAVWAGGSIYNALNVEQDYLTGREQERRLVAFETLLGDVIDAPVPKIRSVITDVDFRPEDQTATIRGEYIIENTTGTPVDRMFMSLVPGRRVILESLEIEGAQKLDSEFAKNVREFGARVFEFDEPLEVGGRARITFETKLPESKLGATGQVRGNGTFVNNFDTMPIPGVFDQRLRNPDTRRRYDLDKYPERPRRDDIAARQDNFFGGVADYVDFEATVCTSPEQVPIAPGKLERIFEQDGRACRFYKAINPILFFFSYLSAEYVVVEDVWTGDNGQTVDLEIYHHAPHDYNIELMLAGMKGALDTFTETYGPYQYNQVRIMEFPYAAFAQAFAGTIPFSENIGFIQDPGDADDDRRVDFASYVTMHEIGHQWFAHQIVAANTRGFNVLSEGLTENAALTAYEESFGWKAAKQIIEWRAAQNYLQLRSADPSSEPPLAEAGDQLYLNYHKANWVFWGLKQYIGNDNMQSAIRGFLEEFGTTGPPYPTTAELIGYLREAAGPDYQQLITDYWERITFWKLSFGDEEPAIRQLDDGRFEVTLTFKTDKTVADEDTGKEYSVTGHDQPEPDDEKKEPDEGEEPKTDAESDVDAEEETELKEPFVPEALNEWIEVGFYTDNPKASLGYDWMALERVNVTDLETTHTFIIPERPTHILLDPRRLLIEVDVKNNLKILPRQSASLN